MNKKRKSWFTLIEMLIVIVILGILSAAILPKLTGYLQQTRDLKRYTDIENLGNALMLYTAHHWSFPLRKHIWGIKDYNRYFGSASDIEGLVPDYLNSIPQDPQKKNMIKIHKRPAQAQKSNNREYNVSFWRGKNWGGGSVLQPWEYLYQTLTSSLWNICYDSIALVSHMETSQYANYIINPQLKDFTNTSYPWSFWHDTWHYSNRNPQYQCSKMPRSRIHLCSSLEKVEEGEEVYPNATNSNCKYSDKNDLFYVKILE